jgi:hypothetical protein
MLAANLPKCPVLVLHLPCLLNENEISHLLAILVETVLVLSKFVTSPSSSATSSSRNVLLSRVLYNSNEQEG